MALTGLRIRLPITTKRAGSGVDLMGGLRPARLLLAALIGAFVLALLYVLQIQSLVQMGTQIVGLEDDLAAELIKHEALRVELAQLHDLTAIERRALLDLDMTAIERQNVVPVPELPDGIDVSGPPWSEPAQLTKLRWWQQTLIRLNEIIHQMPAHPAVGGPRG